MKENSNLDKKTKSITLLGSSSGRNAGDAALLNSIMSDLKELDPDLRFEIPTINPSFITKSFSKYNAKPISMLPWHFSIKMLGFPTFLSVARTDMIIIFDAILFDRALYNPLFNFLSTLYFLIPFAKRKGKKIVYYNVGVGPITTTIGKKMLKKISEMTDLITVRDSQSIQILKSLKIPESKIFLTADAALNNTPCTKGRTKKILSLEKIRRDRPFLGFNINAYVDTWVETGREPINIESFLRDIASVLDKVIEDLNVNVIFFATQHMDIPIISRVINLIRNKERVNLITNKRYSSQEIMGLLGEIELFIGMRLHSLILASAMHTPILGLVYQDKVRNYLRELNLEEQRLEFSNFNVENLFNITKKSWYEREKIKKHLSKQIEELKKKAKETPKMVIDLLYKN
ncbi:MAG: polysaccharide pyruvyl transferase family protein [Actinobacteria bacterium]|nr:polysaccharide pyruvyl transferase family protein [Actinomycetota bacterium]